MGPRIKLPKSPGYLSPQPLVDLSALENFQPRPVDTFSVAQIPVFHKQIPVYSGVPGPPGPHLTDRRVVTFHGVFLDAFVTLYSI